MTARSEYDLTIDDREWCKCRRCYLRRKRRRDLSELFGNPYLMVPIFVALAGTGLVLWLSCP